MLLSLTLSSLFASAVAPAIDEPSFDLVRYDIALRVEPETRLVHGEATATIAARDSAVTSARFALNELLAVAKVSRDGAEAKLERGERVAEGRSLVVALDPPLEAGRACQLTFSYEGQGLDPDEKGADWMGILLVRADEVRMSHQAQWYPIVPRDAEARSKLAAPVKLELDLPAGLESLGPGTLGPLRKEKGREVHVWTSEQAAQPSILAGKFKAQAVKRGKTTLRVLSFPEHASGAKAWAQDAGTSLDALSELFGKLDSPSYGLGEMRVRNRQKSYNYEADGFSVYDGVLFDGRAPDAKKIAHEVAHCWFGGAVDATGDGERFLTEGMAEHAAWMCVEARSGEAAAVEAARAGLERYLGSPGDEVALADADFRSPRYSQVVYAKGAFALRTLRAWIGNDKFLAGLKEYLSQAKARRGVATFDDFLTAMRASGGAAVDTWADDWLRRSGSPQYAVELSKDGGALIQSGALYRNPVELELHLASGKKRIITVAPTELSQPWSSDGPAKVESVVIDPSFRILFPRQQ